MFRVNKTFLTLQMGIMAEFIMFSKGKSISSVSNISSKNFHGESCPILSTNHQLADHPRDSALLSAVGRFDSQQQLWPGKLWWVEIHVVEPMRNSHQCHHGHFVHGPLGKNRDGWGKRLTVHGTGHPNYLIIKLLIC